MLQADFCKPIVTPSDEKSIHQVFSSLNWPKENEFDGRWEHRHRQSSVFIRERLKRREKSVNLCLNTEQRICNKELFFSCIFQKKIVLPLRGVGMCEGKTNIS